MPQPAKQAKVISDEINEMAKKALVEGILHHGKINQEKLKSIFWRLNKEYKLKPTSPLVHALYGKAYCLKNNEAKSKESHLRSIELDPKKTNHLYDFGVTLIYFKKYKEAIKYLDKTLEIVPDYYQALFQKAKAFFFWGKYEKAYNAITKATKMKKSEEYSQLMKNIMEKYYPPENMIRKEIIDKINKSDEDIKVGRVTKYDGVGGALKHLRGLQNA